MKVKSIIKILSVLALLLFVSSALSMEQTKILAVSLSRKTISIDWGYLEGLKIGDRAKFITQVGEIDFPTLKTVAEGEAVKVHSNYSYWHIKKLHHPAALKKGATVLVVTQEKALIGRRPYRVRQKKVIVSGDRGIREFIQEKKRGRPDSVVKMQKDYVESDPVVVTKQEHWEDIRTTDFDKWKETESDSTKKQYSKKIKEKYVERMDEVVDQEKIKEKHRRKVYDSTVEGTINKTNKLENGLYSLYKEQSRGTEAKIVQDKPLIDNMYNTYRKKAREETVISSTAINKIRSSDVLWSADMTDGQLRRFFVESGISREKERQRFALGNKLGNEILIRYNLGLNNKAGKEDLSNQGVGHTLGLGYEYFLMRTSPALLNFTTELFLEKGLNYYDMGSYNARSIEQLYKIMVNWYFYQHPSSITRYIMYGGLGIKFGSADLSSGYLIQGYGFQYQSYPLQVGLKYRFNAGDETYSFVNMGWGFNLVLSYERISLSANENILDSNIESTISAHEFKLGLGVSLLF